MLLNLGEQLRRQAHPASLAGTSLGERDRDAAAAVEDHVVALNQVRVDPAYDLVALFAGRGDRGLELLDFGGDLELGLREFRASLFEGLADFLDPRGAAVDALH